MKTISNWKCIERFDLLYQENLSQSSTNIRKSKNIANEWKIEEKKKRKNTELEYKKNNNNNNVITIIKYGMCEVRSAPNNLASNDVAYLYSSIW